MKQRTDEELLLCYREGDSEGLECLVRRYERPLYGFLARYLGDSHLAEDVFQETFLRLGRAAGEFDASREFRPWLYAIAANLARDALRKRKVRRAARLCGVAADPDAREPLEIALQDCDPDAILPLEAAQRNEEAYVLNEGIEQLGPDFRTVVRLHFFRGMKYREIAEALAIPLGTVKSRIHTAIRQLELYVRERFGEAEASEPCPTTVESASG